MSLNWGFVVVLVDFFIFKPPFNTQITQILDDNAVTKGIIETIEKDLAELNNRLDRINKEFMDGVGVAPRFTGEAYITYES